MTPGPIFRDNVLHTGDISFCSWLNCSTGNPCISVSDSIWEKCKLTLQDGTLVSFILIHDLQSHVPKQWTQYFLKRHKKTLKEAEMHPASKGIPCGVFQCFLLIWECWSLIAWQVSITLMGNSLDFIQITDYQKFGMLSLCLISEKHTLKS